MLRGPTVALLASARGALSAADRYGRSSTRRDHRRAERALRRDFASNALDLTIIIAIPTLQIAVTSTFHSVTSHVGSPL